MKEAWEYCHGECWKRIPTQTVWDRALGAVGRRGDSWAAWGASLTSSVVWQGKCPTSKAQTHYVHKKQCIMGRQNPGWPATLSCQLLETAQLWKLRQRETSWKIVSYRDSWKTSATAKLVKNYATGQSGKHFLRQHLVMQPFRGGAPWPLPATPLGITPFQTEIVKKGPP